MIAHQEGGHNAVFMQDNNSLGDVADNGEPERVGSVEIYQSRGSRKRDG
jgi:hypothetical protein